MTVRGELKIGELPRAIRCVACGLRMRPDGSRIVLVEDALRHWFWVGTTWVHDCTTSLEYFGGGIAIRIGEMAETEPAEPV